MSQRREKSTGKVKWFSDFKGYGFIAPDEEGEELFVHQSAIKSDGYRTLRENDEVEFAILLGSNGKTQAIDVTAPGGAPISSKKDFNGVKNNGRSGGRGYGGASRGGNTNNGNGGGGLSTCYNCGGVGHRARECPSTRSNSAGCYNCGDTEHFARDCPTGTNNYNNNNHNGNLKSSCCYTCGKSGHLARDCNNAGSGERSNGGGACFGCGQFGHLARDCVKGGNIKGCYSCQDILQGSAA